MSDNLNELLDKTCIFPRLRCGDSPACDDVTFPGIETFMKINVRHFLFPILASFSTSVSVSWPRRRWQVQGLHHLSTSLALAMKGHSHVPIHVVIHQIKSIVYFKNSVE